MQAFDQHVIAELSINLTYYPFVLLLHNYFYNLLHILILRLPYFKAWHYALLITFNLNFRINISLIL